MKKWIRSLIENFFIGGLITASISYSGTFVSPLLAAIWWAFPVSLLPSMYYMQQMGRSNKYIGAFALTTTFAVGLLFLTTLAIGHFFNHAPTGFWMPVLKGVGVWAVLSILYYLIVKWFHLEKHF